MKTIGFVISHKESELRRAIVPSDLECVAHRSALYMETRYGESLGYSDHDYSKYGINIVDRNVAFRQDIVCCPKTPEPDERELFCKGQTFFGWVHAVQGRQIVDFLTSRGMTAIAWDDMHCDGRHVFWRNNEIAGETAVMHAFMYFGRVPYECTAAVIGRGNTARGAISMLEKFGSKVVVYDRNSVKHLSDELGHYDVIVNAVLWDVFRTDRLIYREDLARMKRGAMIIDISCDDALEIESSHSTTLQDPVYEVDGIKHYVADHTPSIAWKSASESISCEIKNYVDLLVECKESPVLQAATVIADGVIKDERIKRFQHREN